MSVITTVPAGAQSRLYRGLPYSDFRRRSLTVASARRQLWQEHHVMSTARLRRELAVHQYHLSEACRPYRSDHLREVSRWYVRMITTELAGREVA